MTGRYAISKLEAEIALNGPEILVTSFTTYGTPLIRYRIGDKVVFGSGMCECGSCHPIVDRIEGRRVDYLFSKECGRVSLSHLADVIKGFPNCVKEMQFVQTNMDMITVKLVVDEPHYAEKYDKKIIDAMRERFGESVGSRIEHVNSIPRESSGKFSLTKNLVGRVSTTESLVTKS